MCPQRVLCSGPLLSLYPAGWVLLVAPGAGLALGSVALVGHQQHLPCLPACPGRSSAGLMCIPTHTQHRVHAQLLSERSPVRAWQLLAEGSPSSPVPACGPGCDQGRH